MTAGGTTLPKSTIGFQRGFTGYQLDEESGLYYARARMYSPSLGRFVSRDQISAAIIRRFGRVLPAADYLSSLNLYAGVFVPNMLDPSGLKDCPSPESVAIAALNGGKMKDLIEAIKGDVANVGSGDLNKLYNNVLMSTGRSNFSAWTVRAGVTVAGAIAANIVDPVGKVTGWMGDKVGGKTGFAINTAIGAGAGYVIGDPVADAIETVVDQRAGRQQREAMHKEGTWGDLGVRVQVQRDAASEDQDCDCRYVMTLTNADGTAYMSMNLKSSNGKLDEPSWWQVWKARQYTFSGSIDGGITLGAGDRSFASPISTDPRYSVTYSGASPGLDTE